MELVKRMVSLIYFQHRGVHCNFDKNKRRYCICAPDMWFTSLVPTLFKEMTRWVIHSFKKVAKTKADLHPGFDKKQATLCW